MNTFNPMAELTTVKISLSRLLFEIGILPLGYSVKRLLKLHELIYGLRQASPRWFIKFSSTLYSHGFAQRKSDYFLFTYGANDSLVILLVYVPDIILVDLDKEMINKVQPLLQQFILQTQRSLRF
ncbi:hypothetical protein CR513_35453, partial [Mucuna pruriens]